jgi:CheY-like chemotaxis protein
VGHIIEESLFPKFTVLRTLYGLSQRGVIKIRDPGDGAGTPITVLRRRVTPPEERAHARGRSVLVLSELPTFRAALATVLRSAGFDVFEGRPSDETAGVLRVPADVIVLDMPLETKNGLAFCAVIREKLKLPFVILTGNPGKQAIMNAIQSGARYVLVKPVRNDLLVERISNVLKA